MGRNINPCFTPVSVEKLWLKELPILVEYWTDLYSHIFDNIEKKKKNNNNKKKQKQKKKKKKKTDP